MVVKILIEIYVNETRMNNNGKMATSYLYQRLSFTSRHLLRLAKGSFSLRKPNRLQAPRLNSSSLNVPIGPLCFQAALSLYRGPLLLSNGIV